MNIFSMLIILCTIVIFSTIFETFSRKTNFPAVLSLLILGVVMQLIFKYYDIDFEKQRVLEILGNVGIILIVLEASLDLKVSSEKKSLIIKSFWIAFISLATCLCLLSSILRLFYQNLCWIQCSLYALPLSLVSSAIVIPSVHHMEEDKRDFLIYESTFSDILGIMAFYLLVNNLEVTTIYSVSINIISNTLLTIVVSILCSIALFYIFHKMVHRHIQFSVFMAILVSLYSIGKLFHLSSLLLILIYGILLSNHRFLVKRFHLPKNWVNPNLSDELLFHFKLITDEGSFVIRTLFFVLFGMFLSFDNVFTYDNMIIAGAYILGIYSIHFILLKIFFVRDIIPELYIAPRGLISILLFFAIPSKYLISEIDSGLLFIVIVFTSIVMGVGLMTYTSKR